ncbi:DoxX family protein [Streptomyces sp. NPDC056149]|uniref:DoxX family protein n=1 Tax=Streptomyces sp. NPDC056149 TaxID=3345728 RepID=UPI0035D8FB0F
MSLSRKFCLQPAENLGKFAYLPQLVLRVSVGFMFLSGAVGKLADLDGFAGALREAAVPLPLAGVVAPVLAAVELVAGVALMLGIGTRLASLVLGVTMVGALITTVAPPLLDRYPNPWTWLSNLFYQPEWLLLGLLAWFVCVGGGRFSVDAWVQRRRAPESDSGTD